MPPTSGSLRARPHAGARRRSVRFDAAPDTGSARIYPALVESHPLKDTVSGASLPRARRPGRTPAGSASAPCQARRQWGRARSRQSGCGEHGDTGQRCAYPPRHHAATGGPPCCSSCGTPRPDESQPSATACPCERRLRMSSTTAPRPGAPVSARNAASATEVRMWSLSRAHEPGSNSCRARTLTRPRSRWRRSRRGAGRR